MIQSLPDSEIAKTLSIYGTSVYFVIHGEYNRLRLNAGKFTSVLAEAPGRVYACNDIQELIELKRLCVANNALLRVYIDGVETR